MDTIFATRLLVAMMPCPSDEFKLEGVILRLR
jgi:hypothetical protein